MNEDIIEKYSSALDAVNDYIRLAHTSTDGGAQLTWLFNYLPVKTEIKGVPFTSPICIVDESDLIYRVSLELDEASAKDAPNSPGVFQVKNAIPLEGDEGQLTLLDVLFYIRNNEELSISSTNRKQLEKALKKFTPGATPAKSPKAPAAIYPELTTLLNSKIENTLISRNDVFGLTGTLDTTGQMKLHPVGVGPNKTIYSWVGLLYEGEDPRFKTGLRLKGYDRQTYDAVSTLYTAKRQINGNRPIVMTAQEIWNCMNGVTSAKAQRKITPKQQEKLSESMDKFGDTRIDLDITQEIINGYFKAPEEDAIIVGGRYQGKLLHFDKISMMTDKGKTIDAYRILDTPILCYYSTVKRHAISIDTSLLDTSDKISTSDDVIAFRNYLARQVANMKSGVRKKNRIKLETLYKDTGTEPPEETIVRDNYTSESNYAAAIRKKAKTDRDKIEAILESWKEREWIKGYEEVKQGQAGQIIAIDILL